MRFTQEGEAFGSPAYMSPEQCLGEELDVRSDIYSFGCLMYEALTGAPPLVGDNVLATVAKQVRETPVSMRAHDSTISDDIDEVVLKCLSKEPLLRYQKASDLRVDLEKIKEGGYINSSGKRARKPLKTEKQSGESQSLRNTEDSYRKVASLVAVVLLVAVLVGGITGGVVWLIMQKQAGTERTVQVPTNPAANARAKPQSNTAEKPPSSEERPPAKSPVSTPAMQQVKAAPSKVSVQKPTAGTVTLQKPAPQADAAKRHTAASARQSPHAQRSNSDSWDQLKILRVHK